MKPEKKATNRTEPLRLNDIGFRLTLIPFFGIAVPLLTHMIDAKAFTHWQLKLAYGYTILLAFIIWQGNRYLLFSLRNYFNWFNKPLKKIFALVLSVSFFTIPVSSILLIGWYQLFKNGSINWQVVNTSTLIIMICVLFITHVYETVFLVKESESEMVKNEQLERAKAEAELQALKNQIDPHFIFNSLNALSYLIDESPKQAKQFNQHLADVYRYILQSKSRELVMLEEEMEFLRDFFSLLSIRYGDAATMEIDIERGVLQQYLLPPISLQVLAENAFKHNDFSPSKPLHIKVWFEKEMLFVHNSVTKKASPKFTAKTGLANLEKRYKLLTGQSMKFHTTSTDFTAGLPLLKID